MSRPNLKNKRYDHKKVEEKWQKRWSDNKTFSIKSMKDAKKPFYNLMMFPYPSAEGLHAGNVFAFTGSDVFGRLKRMQGYDLFEPIGLDGFGIHSENYAIKVGRSPNEHARISQANFYKQLHLVGNGFDWDRTLETYDPTYYAWTQWVFIQMFKSGLAYRKSAEVNWCPSCKTVLADEQVVKSKDIGKIHHDVYSEGDDEANGVCERCGTVVIQKKLEQWFFRITQYANRLEEDLKDLNWTDRVKIAQKNWIGIKEGINITYNIKDSSEKITVWTSRPDTNFGATFIVISPDNALVNSIVKDEYKEVVAKYIKEYLKKSKANKDIHSKKKTGVFTGSYAINNLNGEELPIWISDFVLSGVGTGAVVGVPGHDKRDFEFAKQFKLPVKRVVIGDDGDKSEITKIEQVQEDNGKMIASGFLDGMDIHKAKDKIMDYLVTKGWGKKYTNHHLRDWLISRQRYWGPPIPMIYCEHCAREGKSWLKNNLKKTTRGLKILNHNHSDWESAGWYPDENLPVELPKIDDFLPKGNGRGPLADHPEFYLVTCPECKKEAHRETDVSDTFLDSAWYFLAYPIIGSFEWKNGPTMGKFDSLFDEKVIKKWLPVDLYFGGAEHAVLHLMYARFVTKVLHDLGLIHFDEPFKQFYAHGLVIKDGAKMSKSKGNVVNPDTYIEKYGADTLRLYLMFMGPMDGYPDFRDTGIEGMRRFVERIWDTVNADLALDLESEQKILVKMHQTIKKVTEDIEHFRYNTAISAIMEYVNALRAQIPNKSKSDISSNNHSKVWQETIQTLAQLIAPFAPHIAEEMWEKFGKPGSVHTSLWPKHDDNQLETREVNIIVQVNGKLRGTILVPVELGFKEKELIDRAKSDSNVSKWLTGEVKKTIFVPGKIINFVIKG